MMVAEPEWAQELPDARGFVKAEVVHACRSEGAVSLEDVLDRRLQVGLHLDAVTPALVQSVAALMEDAQGRETGSAGVEVSDYLARMDRV